jgi:hypothetical protein
MLYTKQTKQTNIQNDALFEELQRVTGICEAHRELLKNDAALSKHVAEMDEFEERSRMDRAKALSGKLCVVCSFILIYFFYVFIWCYC